MVEATFDTTWGRYHCQRKAKEVQIEALKEAYKGLRKRQKRNMFHAVIT